MPPPPQKKKSLLPPTGVPSGAQDKKVPTPLASTARVKIIRSFDGYKVVTTTMGLIVGSRLDKGKSTWYPDSKTSGLTLEQANISLREWDRFMLEQEPKTAKKKKTI